VRAEHTLRRRGRARGVEDGGIVLGADLDRGQVDIGRDVTEQLRQVSDAGAEASRLRPSHQDVEPRQLLELGRQSVQSLLVADQDRRARVPQAVREFGTGPPRVERNDDGAGSRRSPKRHRPLGEVPHRDRDPIALPHAVPIHQLARELRRAPVVPFEGPVLLLVDEEVELAVGAALGKDRRQRRRCVLPNARRDPADRRVG
jgi:hypothetical protein